MPRPNRTGIGRTHLDRDNQQWVLDYFIQQTGRTFHWWSGASRSLPESVLSHAMISKHLGRKALEIEAEATELEKTGDDDAALERFYDATMSFMKAQHPIFELNDEKRFLYEGLRRCYDKVRALSSYEIERVTVSFEGSEVSGFLHKCPGVDIAPVVFYIPGSDVTCEMWPKPWNNSLHARDMHVFSFDGPGVGQSNFRSIRLTSNNYERAASCVLDDLVQRSDVDPAMIGLLAVGTGGFWGSRFASYDHRLKAAATKSTYTDKYYLMNEESPRWKQLFAFLTRSESESELDEFVASSTLDGYMEKIECPMLMVAGEYDMRDPIEEVYELFDQLQSPSELWVFADQFHQVSLEKGPSVQRLMIDWLVDRIHDVPMKHPGEVLYIEPGDAGPFSADVKLKRRWFEPAR